MEVMKTTVWIGMFCLILASGCGGSQGGPETEWVQGRVNLNGQPVKDGEIIFEPVDFSASSAGKIEGGQFSFKSRLGMMLVRISSMEEIESDPKEASVDLGNVDTPQRNYRSLIPKQYNSETTLKIEVTRDGKNNFAFDLTTDNSRTSGAKGTRP
ncbi:MAG TPA: hypothetical protein VNQ76_02025 [Planctomicrobium sp.]|nr:hypothetical protein [Planctomicrobium sp.]